MPPTNSLTCSLWLASLHQGVTVLYCHYLVPIGQPHYTKELLYYTVTLL